MGARTESLVGLLEKSVGSNPHAVALVDESSVWTYLDLWQHVEKVAAFLRECGIRAGDRVGILLDNSAEYVATYYGTLRQGGICVPLNAAAKSRDLAGWLKHSGAKFLFAQHENPELVATLSMVGPALRVIFVRQGDGSGAGAMTWADVLACERTADGGEQRCSPEDVAAIVYTSGTTGSPKGVTLTHENLVANTTSILNYLELSDSDSCLNVLPFYYSYGNSVLHTHLTSGGRIVLEKNLMYPHNVVKRIETEKVSCFYGVPSTYALLLARVKLADYDLSHVRFLAQAGGPMPPASIQRLRDSVPGAQLYVMYGQTEATARITYLPPNRLTDKLGSVGIPIPGVQIRISGKDRISCRVGEIGEICVAGKNVMRGYWDNADKTAQVLQDGWLRTGDLGKQDTDGFLYIVGRASDMIKIGAHRVSPTDVEEVIMELEGVAEVAVVGVPDDILGQVIRAVVVRKAQSSIDANAVRAHCRTCLAPFKVPKFVEFVTALPRTASGKVKRFELGDTVAAVAGPHQ